MTRPRLLDLFCGAGGCSMGYHQAGFEVVGVDLKPQPRYPFTFVQADAMTYPLGGFDAIHASPPCQHYSMISRNFGFADNHPDLLAPTRVRLAESGVPWVIENVPGAPMRTDYRLCGCMFGLMRLRRERWFETSWRGFDLMPGHDHRHFAISVVGHSGSTSWVRGKLGRNVTLAELREVMGIDWMSGEELSHAIPPAYTEYIGAQLLDHLAERAA